MKGKVVKQIRNCKITEVQGDVGLLYYVYSYLGDLMFVSLVYTEAQNWCLTNAEYLNNQVTYERMKQSAMLRYGKYDEKAVKAKAGGAPKYVYMVTVKKEPAYDEYDNGVEVAGVFATEQLANKAKAGVKAWLKKEGYDEAEVMVGRFEMNVLEYYDLVKTIK